MRDMRDMTFPPTSPEVILAHGTVGPSGRHFLMPQPGRTFPATITLPHDYPAYYRDATHTLYTTGHATRPDQPLTARPPTTFTVTGDPLHLCDLGPRLAGDSRDEVIQGDFYMASTTANELMSPLIRLLPHVARHLSPEAARALVPSLDSEPPSGVPVRSAADDIDDHADHGLVDVALGPTCR